MEAQTKTRVLIVDDDQTLCDMYAERLKAEGFEVVVAHNGEEGVAKATQYLPNVILLDLMMPKVNGFNALEILKSTEATKDIPVLLLTALIQEENKRRGLQAGAEDYIIKSENMPSDVITKIKTAIEKSRQARVREAGGAIPQQQGSEEATAPVNQPTTVLQSPTEPISDASPNTPPPPPPMPNIAQEQPVTMSSPVSASTDSQVTSPSQPVVPSGEQSQNSTANSPVPPV